jgi:radical SAM/Cys-rich protein
MKDTRFHKKVLAARSTPLSALEVPILQVNIGYRCNLACKHCHIGAGPARSEMMDKGTINDVLEALSSSGIGAIDITGGAPEMNQHFRYLVTEARRLGRHVIVRTNLAVFSDEGMDDLPGFYYEHDAELVASLPYYLEDNVDRVRGSGTFKKCIAALRQLNDLGYGDGGRVLNLVYNPQGAFLAPDQATLETEYKRELHARFGISFTKLFTFTNMPIGRFRDFLVRSGNLEKYLDTLACSFNPATLDGIMCRHLVSVGWDGRLYDCDFNQVLGMTVDPGVPSHIRDFDLPALSRREIQVADHCFGCAAGQGST